MDILQEDHTQLLILFIDNNVDFMLIGGYAVIHYGYERSTADMDIWIKPSEENKIKLINSLRQYGIEEEDLNQLPYWINKISSFCNNYTEYEIGFDGFYSFGSYVFYVKLDDGSVKYFNKLILDIHRYFGFKIKNPKNLFIGN